MSVLFGHFVWTTRRTTILKKYSSRARRALLVRCNEIYQYKIPFARAAMDRPSVSQGRFFRSFPQGIDIRKLPTVFVCGTRLTTAFVRFHGRLHDDNNIEIVVLEFWRKRLRNTNLTIRRLTESRGAWH